MPQFEPFYIYAQSLDNTSDDSMYQIKHSDTIKAERITELAEAQSIMQDIHAVATDINLNNRIMEQLKKSNKITSDLLSVFTKNRQVVIKLKTDDKDNLGRHSPIIILLTLPQDSNYAGFIPYLSNGLLEFCKITDRHPKTETLELINKLYLDKLASHDNPIFQKKIVKGAVILAVVLVVYFLLIK